MNEYTITLELATAVGGLDDRCDRMLDELGGLGAALAIDDGPGRATMVLTAAGDDPVVAIASAAEAVAHAATTARFQPWSMVGCEAELIDGLSA